MAFYNTYVSQLDVHNTTHIRISVMNLNACMYTTHIYVHDMYVAITQASDYYGCILATL